MILGLTNGQVRRSRRDKAAEKATVSLNIVRNRVRCAVGIDADCAIAVRFSRLTTGKQEDWSLNNTGRHVSHVLPPCSKPRRLFRGSKRHLLIISGSEQTRTIVVLAQTPLPKRHYAISVHTAVG